MCVLPQLLLLRQTTVPTVIDSFYLLTLGSYRAFYILNWIWRGFYDIHKPGPIEVIFGIVQTACYVDFAWIYWSRQRVKLRNGGVVDSDDLSRGWLISKVLGRGTPDLDEEDRVATNDEDHAQTARHVGSRSGWGARGISVSADEGLPESRGPRSRPFPVDPDAIARLEEAVGILEGDEDDESDDEILPSNNGTTSGSLKGVGNGEEWRNQGSK